MRCMQMNAEDIMIHSVITVTDTENVETVLRKFVEYRISGVPIVVQDNKIVGYISDGDVMRAFAQQYHGFHGFDSGFYMFPFLEAIGEDDSFATKFHEFCQRRALDAGVRRVICVQADEPLEQVARILSQRKIKKVPVIKEGRLIGIISRGDVIHKVVSKYLMSNR
ncbi:CBS domain-containing protein [Alicyclobacillaceae bacterium I2511]|nr:CBS domain-containing protein [Alicyclobacillaceae bacterium I2511]